MMTTREQRIAEATRVYKETCTPAWEIISQAQRVWVKTITAIKVEKEEV